MERNQKINKTASRRVAFNADFNGNAIDQNDSAGVIRISKSPSFYPCGHQRIGNIDTCSCVAF